MKLEMRVEINNLKQELFEIKDLIKKLVGKDGN